MKDKTIPLAGISGFIAKRCAVELAGETPGAIHFSSINPGFVLGLAP